MRTCNLIVGTVLICGGYWRSATALEASFVRVSGGVTQTSDISALGSRPAAAGMAVLAIAFERFDEVRSVPGFPDFAGVKLRFAQFALPAATYEHVVEVASPVANGRYEINLRRARYILCIAKASTTDSKSHEVFGCVDLQIPPHGEVAVDLAYGATGVVAHLALGGKK